MGGAYTTHQTSTSQNKDGKSYHFTKQICEWGKSEILFLSHVIGENGIKPNPEKVRAIKQMTSPKTRKEVQQFLGLVNYYRRFIKLLQPITKLLKQDQPWQWETEQDEASKMGNDFATIQLPHNIQGRANKWQRRCTIPVTNRKQESTNVLTNTVKPNNQTNQKKRSMGGSDTHKNIERRQKCE